MGWCTVTSLVPSGKVASTWMSAIISATPSITSARDSTVLPSLISAATDLPSRAPSRMAALAALFALFHGAAHGAELQGMAALAGMVLATALLHGVGLWAGHALRRRSVWWPRAAGIAASLVGAVLLFGAA